jgi:uroporphyrinogen-III synthase
MSLAGKQIVNTRAVHQAVEFDALLRAASAIPLAYPCIAILPPNNITALDQALASYDFDLLVLTSANAVTILAQRLQALGLSLKGVRAAVVGATTARAAGETLGVEIGFIPDEYTTEALDEALAVTPGMRILLPQSEIARRELADSLRARGADVMAITAYRTVRGCGGAALAPLLRARQIDAITFTSPSTVRFFTERLADEGGADIGGVPIACIGPQTSQAARDCGFVVSVEAKPHTLEGLIEGLAAYFQAHHE